MTVENAKRTGHTVVGVFDDVGQAESAINDLKLAGFTPDSISVVTKDRNNQHDLDAASGNDAAQGALVGSLGGGTLGAVLGWLLAGGTALIPGIGPVIAAGVFGATLGGALIGGTLGGITGALAGSGVPEDEALEYEEHVKGGRTLISVNAANGTLLESAMDVFERNNASSTRYYDLNNPGPGRSFTRNDTGGTSSYVVSDTNKPGGPVSPSADYNSTDYNSSIDRTGPQGGAFSSTYGQGRTMDDISTLPDTGQGTSTRGGSFQDRPQGEALPDYELGTPLGGRGGTLPLDTPLGDNDRDNPKPRSI